MQEAYGFFSRVYERYWSEPFAQKIYPAVLFLINSKFPSKSQPLTILDLACGCGHLASYLSNSHSLYGYDASEEQLLLAKTRAPNATYKTWHFGEKIQHRNFDLVLCLYDSLNYVENLKILETTLHEVYESMSPGGYYFFDVNNTMAYESRWQSGLKIIRDDHLDFYYEFNYDPVKKLGEMTASGLILIDNKWEEFSEVHRQIPLDPNNICKSVEKTKFKMLSICEELQKLLPQEVGRDWYLLHKEI